jgi:hypothetical protein
MKVEAEVKCGMRGREGRESLDITGNEKGKIGARY